MDKSEPVVVARVWAESEASVIKNMLEAYGIPSHYTSELPSRIYPVSAEGVAQIRIFVPKALAEEAIELLNGQYEIAEESAEDAES
jgi:hypothetical protein